MIMKRPSAGEAELEEFPSSIRLRKFIYVGIIVQPLKNGGSEIFKIPLRVYNPCRLLLTFSKYDELCSLVTLLCFKFGFWW